MLQITYTEKKLSFQFNIKDKTNFEHQHDLIYHVNFPIPTCEDTCIGETTRCIPERIIDHNGRDHNSYTRKHSIEKYHDNVNQENYKIIAKNFQNNKWKRKISRSPWIKDFRPALNAQEKTLPLKLFN